MRPPISLFQASASPPEPTWYQQKEQANTQDAIPNLGASQVVVLSP
jgi:hypothetical protein